MGDKRWWWRMIVLLWWCEVAVAGGTCYPAGGVAGIVVATIVVTLVVAGLIAAVAWKYWWTPRHTNEGRIRRPEVQQQQQKNPTDFAFDNPYFRNNQEADEHEGTAGRSKPYLNNKSSLRSSKLSEAAAKAKKARGGGKNPFLFGGGKKKAQDDSCIASAEPERAFVSLRGHDFTGLGFNICGNMRDGILVKDVLHRGPASESGLIKAGDKIVNVTVSFTNIVYEDALTILSYASPYDVQLELERVPAAAAAAPKRLGSCSFNNSGQKLFHPLYRSQSIDDLTQIDGGGGSSAAGGGASGGGGTFPSHVGGPRRSQSVGVAAHFRRREQGEDKEDNNGGGMIAHTGSLNEKMLANVMTDSRGKLQWEKRFEDTLDNEDCPKDDNRKKAHLDDYPPTKLKLETRTGTPRNDAVSDVTVVSTRDRTSPPETEPSSRKGRDEENDSDVSRDSLEVSRFAKRNAKSSIAAQKTVDIRQPSGHSRDHSSKKVVTERTYVKDRQDRPSTRTHSNSLSSNEEVQDTTYSRFDSVDSQHAKHPRFDSDNGQHSKPIHVFAGPYGERQRQQEIQNEGGKITVNGGLDPNKVGRSQREEDVARPQPKFAKKAAPAGGMFTQINPFQASSSSKLQQQRVRGPWTREQQNGEQSEFQGRNVGSSGPKLSLKESSMKHRQF